jgi:hypothetical protein
MSARYPRPAHGSRLVASRDEVAHTRWALVLDELEADLAEVERALAAGEVVPDATWTPPQQMGPLPAVLRERIEALAARIDRTHRVAQERMVALRDELQEVDRRRRAGAAYGSDVGRTA